MVAARTTDSNQNCEGQGGRGLVGGSRRIADKTCSGWSALLPLEGGADRGPSIEITQGRVSCPPDAVEQPEQSLPAVLREKLGFLVAVGILILTSVVVLAACGLLLPIRWLIDRDARQERLAGSMRGGLPSYRSHSQTAK